jgi:hypothetical protein
VGHDGFALIWRAYAAVLAEEHAFARLGWPDAGNCAYMIADAIARPDPADVLLNHARDALAGTDGVGRCKSRAGGACVCPRGHRRRVIRQRIMID